MAPDSDDALAVLVGRAAVGDPTALAELRAGLPGHVRWADLEALAGRAREAWADAAAGGEAVGREALLADVGRAAARLARPGAGPLERLLAGRAALADARLADARRAADEGGREGAPPAVTRDLARRAGRAERDAAAAGRVLRAVQHLLPTGP